MMGYKPVEPAGDATTGATTMPPHEAKVVASCHHDGGTSEQSGGTSKVKKTIRLPQELDEALKPKLKEEGVSLNNLIISLLEGWLGGTCATNVVASDGNVVAPCHQNDGKVVAHDGTDGGISGELECIQENIEILFNLNKNREEEIKELKKNIYEIKAELMAYLLDRAENGDISGEQKMEVEEE